MASYTLSCAGVFPEGTSVGAYPASNWPGSVNANAAPPGAATNTQVVSNQQITFTGIANDVQYYAYASVASSPRYLSFSAGTDAGTGSSQTVDGTVTALEQALPSTATLSNVASSTSSVTLLTSNISRRGVTVFNESSSVLYLKFGTTASATSYTVQIAPGAIYEAPRPIYSGRIDGIWTAANGNARITETS